MNPFYLGRLASVKAAFCISYISSSFYCCSHFNPQLQYLGITKFLLPSTSDVLVYNFDPLEIQHSDSGLIHRFSAPWNWTGLRPTGTTPGGTNMICFSGHAVLANELWHRCMLSVFRSRLHNVMTRPKVLRADKASQLHSCSVATARLQLTSQSHWQ